MCIDEIAGKLNNNSSENAEGDEAMCKEESIEELTESSTSTVENAVVDNTEPLVGNCCGSTACVLLLSKEKAYVANVGDSRCVACVKGNAVDLSKDHLPTDEEELLRITKSGHEVKDGRIDDGLNMSRAFGDFGLKEADAQDPVDPVICHPHISVLDINEDLDFIIIASDGIWHELSSQDVVDFVKERKNEDPVDICTELFELLMPMEVTEDGSGCDNMSAIIIFFENTQLVSYVEKTENVRYSYENIGDPTEVTEKEEKHKDSNAFAEYCISDDSENSDINIIHQTNAVKNNAKSTDVNPPKIPTKIIEIDLVSSEDDEPCASSSKGGEMSTNVESDDMKE